MSVNKMKEEWLDNPSPLVNRLVVTYAGSPHPKSLSHLGDIYFVSHTQKKQIFITDVDGCPTDKSFIKPSSVALVADIDHAGYLIIVLEDQRRARSEFHTSQSDFIESICTEVHRPPIRQRTRG